MARPDASEHWRLDAGEGDVALLVVPPALRARRFELDVRMAVLSPADGSGWHALAVEVDGRLAWSRRSATASPGETDSLEWRTRLEVAEGASLKVRARATTGQARRLSLVVEATEVDDDLQG